MTDNPQNPQDGLLFRPKKICICNQVSEEEILDAIHKGYITIEQIREKTKAGTNCQSCLPRIRDILKKFNK